MWNISLFGGFYRLFSSYFILFLLPNLANIGRLLIEFHEGGRFRAIKFFIERFRILKKTDILCFETERFAKKKILVSLFLSCKFYEI